MREASSRDDAAQERLERTFVFVDVAGYTALTAVHGDEQAAQLAQCLIERSLAALGPGDELVKSLGDGVMVTASDPAAAVSFLAALVDATRSVAHFPLIRAGLHHGPAIRQGDDWFGAAVNIAARVADVAGPGQVLATAAAVRSLSDVAWHPLGLVALRHVPEPVELVALELPEDTGMDVDPVCRMRVRRAGSAAHAVHADREFWFCSAECAERFTEHPEAFFTVA